MKTVSIFALVLSPVLLTGCAGGTRNWKEQVILPDGRELIVERTNILGSPLDREFSSYNAPPPVKRYIVTIPLPGGGTATWEADHRDMIPLAAMASEGTAYLVASPFDCAAHARLGSPDTPFFFFKHETDSWRQTKYRDLPWRITEANLMLGSGGQIAINLMEKGTVPSKVIHSVNSNVVRRHIYASGADPYLWRECMSRFQERSLSDK